MCVIGLAAASTSSLTCVAGARTQHGRHQMRSRCCPAVCTAAFASVLHVQSKAAELEELRGQLTDAQAALSELQDSFEAVRWQGLRGCGRASERPGTTCDMAQQHAGGGIRQQCTQHGRLTAAVARCHCRSRCRWCPGCAASLSWPTRERRSLTLAVRAGRHQQARARAASRACWHRPPRARLLAAPRH